MFNAKEQIIAYAKYLDDITDGMTIKETAMKGVYRLFMEQ